MAIMNIVGPKRIWGQRRAWGQGMGFSSAQELIESTAELQERETEVEAG